MPRTKRPDLTNKRSRLLRGKRIGLLGGSFNPAHEGHLHLSKQALRALGLDEIWWLVAPSNPFKDKASLAPFDARLDGALKLTEGHPRIRISDIEAKIGSTRTVTTLRHLKDHYPDIEFVWIAGMDLVHEMHDWQGADEIRELVALAFFERPPLRQGAKRAPMVLHANARPVLNAKTGRPDLTPPRLFVFRRRHTVDQSATALRNAADHATRGAE